MNSQHDVDACEVKEKIQTNMDEESVDEETSVLSTNTKSEKLRKITHSEIERRRREKMNRYIDEIAQLLPIDPAKKLDKLTVLRIAVDTIKHVNGLSSNISLSGFGQQKYLNDNELFELALATIDQMGTYFFLIIECQKGRICYASSSVEIILGYKTTELCSRTIFDIAYSDDVEIIKHQLISEKIFSTINDDSSNDLKGNSLLTTRQNSLQAGNRRSFSCRLRSKTRQSTKTTTDQNFFVPIDFVGYIKQYSLTNDNQIEMKTRIDRRHSNRNILTPSDVLNAIGKNSASCFLTMGNLSQRNEKIPDDINTIDRIFLFKLTPDGHFTYFDQICYSLLGYLSQDFLGTNFKDFIHEDDRNKVSETWNRVICDHQILTSAFYRFRTKDDKYVILQTTFEPFINPWNDELEIIIAKNKLKVNSASIHSTVINKSDDSRHSDVTSPSTLDSGELIRQLLQ